MNNVNLIGRITKDIELRYTEKELAIARFSIAVDRAYKSGDEREADFFNVSVFGKQAENLEKYSGKGKLIAVSGRLQSGSYTNKDAVKVYTVDVIAEKIQFLQYKDKVDNQEVPEGMDKLNEEDIPF